MPDEFRRRNYAATITQDGPSLNVTLTGPEIVNAYSHFSGRVNPDAIEFQIGGSGFYYGYYYECIAEQVSPTQRFEFHGSVRARQNVSTITGSLNGGLEIVNLPTSSTTAQCVAPNNQITLTRAAPLSRHR